MHVAVKNEAPKPSYGVKIACGSAVLISPFFEKRLILCKVLLQVQCVCIHMPVSVFTIIILPGKNLFCVRL